MDTTNTNAMMPTEAAPGTSAVQESTTPSTLAEFLGADAPVVQQAEPQAEVPQQVQKEPGYLAGKRLEWEAAHKAETDQLRSEMATLREYMYNSEADKLVASGKITDRDMALEYVRNKGGAPSAQEQQHAEQQPRDARGRYVARPDANAQQKAATLFQQAQTIKRTTGVDVMGMYNQNPEIRQKILSGEWDFADVYENTKAPVPASAPMPVRGSHTMEMGNVDISRMSDAQFEKMRELLRGGGTINMNK